MMRPALLALPLALLAAQAAAQEPHVEPDEMSGMDHSQMDHGSMDHGQMDHSQMDHGAGTEPAAPHAGHAMDQAPPAPPSAPPPDAFSGPEHAADAVWGAEAMAPSREAARRAMGGGTLSTIMADRLEAGFGKGPDHYAWDLQAWHGGDIDKLWLKSEGEGGFGQTAERAGIQALWSHAIGPFFDLQLGARYDIEPASTGHLVLGVQGLAPYMFEVDAAAFLSHRGDLTGRIEAEYDQRLTQRLILQPRAELELAAQDVPEARIGSGLSRIGLGLRLRYEIVREFAPYIGLSYEAATGRTADMARADGEDPDGLRLLMGVRAWY